MSERQIVRIAAPITQGNDTGYRLGYADEMGQGDTLYASDDYTPPVLLNVGNTDATFPDYLGEDRVTFAEALTRHYAPFFASFTDDERSQLAARLSDMTTDEEAPAATETKAEKKARLAAEKAAALPPEPPVIEPVPPVEPPVDTAPEPAPLPPPPPQPPAAGGWGAAPVV